MTLCIAVGEPRSSLRHFGSRLKIATAPVTSTNSSDGDCTEPCECKPIQEITAGMPIQIASY